MSKFSSAADAAKYLGLLVVTPKHGVVVLQSVKRGGVLEVGDGFNVGLGDCEPADVAGDPAEAVVEPLVREAIDQKREDISRAFDDGYAKGYEEGKSFVLEGHLVVDSAFVPKPSSADSELTPSEIQSMLAAEPVVSAPNPSVESPGESAPESPESDFKFENL